MLGGGSKCGLCVISGVTAAGDQLPLSQRAALCVHDKHNQSIATEPKIERSERRTALLLY